MARRNMASFRRSENRRTTYTEAHIPGTGANKTDAVDLLLVALELCHKTSSAQVAWLERGSTRPDRRTVLNVVMCVACVDGG